MVKGTLVPKRHPYQNVSKRFTLTGFRSGCSDILLLFPLGAQKDIVGRLKSLHVSKCHAQQMALRGSLHASLSVQAGRDLFRLSCCAALTPTHHYRMSGEARR